MSDAKKCDRCGELFVPYDYQGLGDAWRYSIVKCCHPYPDKEFDLCNNCRKSLENWIGVKNE